MVESVIKTMPKLTVNNIKSEQQQVYKLPQDNITIGRVNTCDIELPIKSISRRHAEIVKDGESYYLIDLKSGNGTLLQGKKIKSKEKYLLRSNDKIRIEDYEIIFQYLDENIDKPVDENTDTDIIEIKMIKKVLKALDNESLPSIEVLNSAHAGKKISIADNMESIIVGREQECDFFLDDATVSRQHAKLEKKWGGMVLLDLSSKNGTYVNHEKIKEKVIRDGDKLMFGTVKCLYRNPKDINLDAISKEISRKKREAAIKEAELMEPKPVSQEEQAQQEAVLEQQEAALQAVEKVDQAQQAAEAAKDAAPMQTEANLAATHEDASVQALAEVIPPNAKLSMLDKSLILLAILVGIFAVIFLGLIFW